MSAIHGVNSYTSYQTATTGNTNELGKDAFLKILVAQLQNQDPTEPVKDGEFIGQMAQLSVMEQLSNLSTTLTTYLQSDHHLSQYANILNKKVTWTNPETSKQESGIVTGVKYKDNQVYFNVGDKEILSSSIRSIEVNE